MTSTASPSFTDPFPGGGTQPLYFYTGRVRAFWKNMVFFSDLRNVAVIEIQDVYIHGRRASSRDMASLTELVEKNGWEGAPEFQSYVSPYPCDSPHPWPYQLSGKTLWKAKFAWTGAIPNSIENTCMNNIIYMPISYYTGKIMKYYNDKILFGDIRNYVMVSADNFYVNGERGSSKKQLQEVSSNSCLIIHAYIVRLEVLADTRFTGPEPHLPTWPKEHYSSDMWVAKFAWQGEVPSEVRDQVGRYYKIRMNQWDSIQSVPWKRGLGQQSYSSCEGRMKEKFNSRDKGEERGANEGEHCSGVPLVPVEQKAGLMKGALLLADGTQGLMTSFVDVIAFTKDNFYVNGEKFRNHYLLYNYFQDRVVPLTAWVVPLKKPKVIFNINVVWYAECVWFGSPPRDLEYLKKRNADGKYSSSLVETVTPVKLTHFIGNVRSLSYASGVLMSKAGLDQAVKISFKRKVVYIYGYKFHSSCSLLDKQQTLESTVWSVLAFPMPTDQAGDIPQYQAIAVWQYDYQHFMGMLSRMLSKSVDLSLPANLSELGGLRDSPPGREECGRHLSGWIAQANENYGIIQSGSALVDATYLYFNRSVLYIDGELLPKSVSIQALNHGRQCNMQAKSIPPKNVDGYRVTMEATLVWIGRKPAIESPSRELTPSPECQKSPSFGQTNDACGSVKSCVAAMDSREAEKRSWLERVLYTAEGVMVGDVLMVDNHHGLIVCSNILVAFSSKVFYINGQRFEGKYYSLNQYVMDERVTVRAMVVTLKEPRALFNFLVRAEAVCVWTGPEPSDLRILQNLHQNGKMFQTLERSKISSPSSLLLYLAGKVTVASKDLTLLTCKTPEGSANIILPKESMFINGSAVHRDDIFEHYRSKTFQIWCVLALSIPSRTIMNQTVSYTAIAVWNLNYHHKMRRELMRISSQHSVAETRYKYTTSTETAIEAGTVEKANEAQTEVLSNMLQVGECGGEQNAEPLHQHGAQGTQQDQLPSQLEDPSVIISHIAQNTSGNKHVNGGAHLEDISENSYCGKHITGHIIKKCKGGGVAQWKSLQFEGNVHIEFTLESLYLDLEPFDKKWKIANVLSRPCNLYVIPIPHRKVGDHTVSLKATCGWIGKKPSHLPAPGTQLLTKIDLSSVHATHDSEVPNSVNTQRMPDTGSTGENSHVNGVDAGVYSEGTNLQPEPPQPRTTQQDPVQEQQNGEKLQMNNNVQPVILSPEIENTQVNHSGGIWEDMNKKKGQQRGTIVEVHSSVGQLKGPDGSLHYFSRDHCFLYGVSLCNVELWHVLAQDDPVLFTGCELMPGMIKVKGVWLGSVEMQDVNKAAAHIYEWCKMKLVPDSARDILVHQLEGQ